MMRAAIKAAPREYVITISPDGSVRLSKKWNWCNIPMASVAEFFDPRTVERVNRDAYRVEEAGDYLRRINSEIKAERKPG